MLRFTIFSKGGLILWSYDTETLGSTSDATFNHLIKTILLEERSGENCINHESSVIRWTFANEYDLVFVVAYQKIYQKAAQFVDKLLDVTKERFIDNFKSSLSTPIKNAQFDALFAKTLKTYEDETTTIKVSTGPRTFEQTEKGKEISKKKKTKSKKEKPKEEEKENTEIKPENDSSTNDDDDDPDKKMFEARKRLASRGRGRGGGPAPFTKKPSATSTTPTKKPKAKRVWDDAGPTKEEMESLDKTPDKGKEMQFEKEDFGKIDLDHYEGLSDDDKEDEEEETEEEEKADSSKSKSFFGGWINRLTNRVLERDDLVPVLASFKEHLVAKNVASEIADKLCDSVIANLEGKKLDTFSRINTIVKKSMEEALARILTPKRNIDILREVAAVKSKEKRPYTVVFCGVNGVGKSTNLAKVCYLLLEKGYSVQLVACDTFRAGAVEQLMVHARRLNVPLFERGYGKDASSIAAEGIKQAKEQGIDVVLIDTAGRMQDNEPLMKALSKLVSINNPDLVLFVGEALVGNDAVDQLTKFNKALADLSTSKEPRLIDGIILTKFDTIDDKMGAALSMVYSTGSPIVFVGNGQHYTNLKRMNIDVVVRALLK